MFGWRSIPKVLTAKFTTYQIFQKSKALKNCVSCIHIFTQRKVVHISFGVSDIFDVVLRKIQQFWLTILYALNYELLSLLFPVQKEMRAFFLFLYEAATENVKCLANTKLKEHHLSWQAAAWCTLFMPLATFFKCNRFLYLTCYATNLLKHRCSYKAQQSCSSSNHILMIQSSWITLLTFKTLKRARSVFNIKPAFLEFSWLLVVCQQIAPLIFLHLPISTLFVTTSNYFQTTIDIYTYIYMKLSFLARLVWKRQGL